MRILAVSALFDALQDCRACWNYPSDLKESLCTVGNSYKNSGPFQMLNPFCSQIQNYCKVANLHFDFHPHPPPPLVRIYCLKCHSLNIIGGFVLLPCWGAWLLLKFWVYCCSLLMHRHWLYLIFNIKSEEWWVYHSSGSARVDFSGPAHSWFGYLQGQRLHKMSGQPVLVLDHPHSKKAFNCRRLDNQGIKWSQDGFHPFYSKKSL